jgi:dihydroflavonol-4-reductase
LEPRNDTVFLTGASGFVGAHILRALLASGYSVRALHREAPQHCHPEVRAAGEPRRAEIVIGDLERPGSFAHALEGCRYLVHCAAQYSFAPKDRASIARVNVLGTAGLFAAAHLAGVERAVLTSSSAAVGHARSDVLPNETSYAHEPRNPRAPDYHESKLLQERAAFASRLPAIAVLPTAPVGPGDWKPTPTGGMIVDFMRGKMVARPPASGGMNLVDVEQVAALHVAALQRGRIGARYIAAGENYSFDALWDLFGEVTGVAAPRARAPVPLMYAAAFVEEARARITGGAPFVPMEGVRMSQERMFVDASATNAELGVTPRPVRDALARAVAWYRENGYV